MMKKILYSILLVAAIATVAGCTAESTELNSTDNSITESTPSSSSDKKDSHIPEEPLFKVNPYDRVSDSGDFMYFDGDADNFCYIEGMSRNEFVAKIEAAKNMEPPSNSEELLAALNDFMKGDYLTRDDAYDYMVREYSQDEAFYALAHTDVDWVSKGISFVGDYIATDPHSEVATYKYLLMCGYEDSMAHAIIDSSNVDWNESCVNFISTYVEYDSISDDAEDIKKICIISAGFTEANVEYALAALA